MAAGFTLVEVMVALAVVALALPALMMSLNVHVDSIGHLRDKSMAQMVAANKLDELRILSRARQSLLQGRDGGVGVMAERDWYWWLNSQPTELDNFSRVEISVAATEEQRDQPLYTLVAFISTDLRSEPDETNPGETQPGSQQPEDSGSAGNGGEQ